MSRLGRCLGVAAATVGGNLFLVVGSVVLATLAVLTVWVPPRGSTTFRLARVWSAGLMTASGVRLEVQREAPPPTGGRFIFMANHESLFDIPALLRTLPVRTGFLAKSSLFRIPFVGWALYAGGFVPVERRDPRRARQAFNKALERLQARMSIAIFPEETRSGPGVLLPFKKGGFLLALRTGLPIVPIGLQGAGRIQPKGSLVIRPGRLRVRYGAPIEVQGLGPGDRGALMARVEREIARLAEVEASPAKR